MAFLSFFKKLLGIVEKKTSPTVKVEQLKTVLEGKRVELLSEEVICKMNFFVGECWRVKENPPEGMRPYRGRVLKSFILFNKPDAKNPSNIDSVTIFVDGEEERYQIPGWTWDGMLQLNYENYKYEDMLSTVSNERVIEADFALIDNIKNKVREIYGDLIGNRYTNDDIYTCNGQVIRKYTVVVTDEATNNILLFKTFDAIDDAQEYYYHLITLN